MLLEDTFMKMSLITITEDLRKAEWILIIWTGIFI